MTGKNAAFNRFWWAMCLTLSVHALALLAMWLQPAGISRAEDGMYVAVEFADEANLPEEAHTSLENQLRAAMEARVANLVGDETAAASAEWRSTTAYRSQQQMAAEVAAELKAFEQAEFERLASETKDFGLSGVPDDGHHEVVNTLSEWDKRYEGKVIVSYRIPGRKHIHLPVPGYLCLNAGTVVIAVEIAQDGSVTKAQIQSAPTGEAGVCMSEVALKSALRSVFNVRIDADQSGTITYEFVAQ